MTGRIVAAAVGVLLLAGLRDAPAPGVVASGGFVALSVRNLDATTRWYEEAFGLKVTMQTPHQNQSQVTVLGGPGIIVELVQRDSAHDEAGDPALRHGLMKAGWIVSDFDSVVARLRARHVDLAYGPFPPRPDSPANVIIRDNEGNLIQVFGR